MLDLNSNHTIKLSSDKSGQDKLYFLGLLLNDKDVKLVGNRHSKLAVLN